ncbi:MAG: hypothetical protein PHV33_00115 [Elusimicrobiales bacterium]|nr:hypothetical protein [Elusimicrobiales bacterium]
MENTIKLDRAQEGGWQAILGLYRKYHEEPGKPKKTGAGTPRNTTKILRGENRGGKIAQKEMPGGQGSPLWWVREGKLDLKAQKAGKNRLFTDTKRAGKAAAAKI